MGHNKIVILKLGALGDLLMLTPALRGYKKSSPDNIVHFIVGKTNVAVLKNSPYIDNLYIIDDEKIFKGGLKDKLYESDKILKIIKEIKPDKIFVMHRDWRWNLLAFLSGVKHRIGFKRDLRGLFLSKAVEVSREEHEIFKYAEILGVKDDIGFNVKMDIFPDERDKKVVDGVLARFADCKNIVAIAPGGASNAKQEMQLKRWPIGKYKKLIVKILETTDLGVLLIGAISDNIFTRELIIDKNRILDVSGKFSIQQSFLALKNCRAFVTHDNGAMHIGAAAEIPIVSVFGPTNPLEYCPITNPKSIYIWHGSKLKCSPCYKDGVFPDCKDLKCMRIITVKDVFDRLMEII